MKRNRIHATALVEDGVELAADVQVGPYCVVQAPARIGRGSVLGPHVVVHPFTVVGEACRLHANVVLGDIPQDLAFEEVESSVLIGAGCTLREGVTIHRGTKPGTRTEVGPGCLLMAYAHLGHNVCLGREVILANGALLGGYVQVGDRVFISGHCLVHQFVRIGRGAMLGGGSGVSQDVPPFCTTRPLVPNLLMGLNTVGLRRMGIAAGERTVLRRVFHQLFLGGRNRREVLAQLASEDLPPTASELVAFVREAQRGVCRCRPVLQETP